MFRGCYNLERLDLTNSCMSKVKNMASLCFHLENLKDDIVNIGLHFFHKDVRLYAASCSEV